MNYFGDERSHLLNIGKHGDDLSATMRNELDGDIEITKIDFNDEVLRYEYATPPSQMDWAKGAHSKMIAWLKVSGESIEGALSMAEDIPIDLPLRGRRVRQQTTN